MKTGYRRILTRDTDRTLGVVRTYECGHTGVEPSGGGTSHAVCGLCKKCLAAEKREKASAQEEFETAIEKDLFYQTKGPIKFPDFSEVKLPQPKKSEIETLAECNRLLAFTTDEEAARIVGFLADKFQRSPHK